MFLGVPYYVCNKNKKLREKLHYIYIRQVSFYVIVCDFALAWLENLCHFWIYATIIVLTWFGIDDMQ
jgi:hypothetical protein